MTLRLHRHLHDDVKPHSPDLPRCTGEYVAIASSVRMVSNSALIARFLTRVWVRSGNGHLTLLPPQLQSSLLLENPH